jgi:RNA polymerase sigma-B factor
VTRPTTTIEVELPALAQASVPRDPDGSNAVPLELWELHLRHQQRASSDTRAALVDAYLPYATSIAYRMHRMGEPLDDLVQVASEALLVAIERFDSTRGIPFKGFATPTIEGSIKRHFRDHGWAMRVPRRVHELAGPVRHETERLTLELGTAPTDGQVAEVIGVSAASIGAVRQAMEARSVGSLDRAVRPGDTPVEPPNPVDLDFERAENHVSLMRALTELSSREREVIRRYYIDDETQSEIAAAFGVSQMQVSRWLAAATQRLRRLVMPT